MYSNGYRVFMFISAFSGCPAGLAFNYYIADTTNQCIFYWCLGGTVIDVRDCAPGAAVPPMYMGMGNPCTRFVGISTCSGITKFPQIPDFPWMLWVVSSSHQ